jgi:hypothetical protein
MRTKKSLTRVKTNPLMPNSRKITGLGAIMLHVIVMINILPRMKDISEALASASPDLPNLSRKNPL